MARPARRRQDTPKRRVRRETSAAVAASGIIGWVGLVVPHLARLVVGPAFTRFLPVSVLFGAGDLLAADTVARTIGRVELPLGGADRGARDSRVLVAAGLQPTAGMVVTAPRLTVEDLSYG
jgi:hypothetical protein